MWRQSAKSSLINFVILFITGLSDFQKVPINRRNAFLLFIGTFEKCLEVGDAISPVYRHLCLEVGETQFLLFIGAFEKCL